MTATNAPKDQTRNNESEAQASAMIKAASAAAQLSIEQMMPKMLEDAKKIGSEAGREAAQEAIKSAHKAEDRYSKLKDISETSFYVGGAVFFIGSAVMLGVEAVRSFRKDDSSGTVLPGEGNM